LNPFSALAGNGSPTWNRRWRGITPPARNALNTQTKQELLAALRQAAGDPQVRAVVLTGQGRAFCAGQDLREHAESLAAGNSLGNTVREHYNPITETIAAAATRNIVPRAGR